MLSLTRKADYAFVALTCLAREQAGPVPVRQIAERFRLPLALLSNVLKDLAQAKLVRSTRGATGGYALAADPRNVTLIEIVHAVEGPVQLSQCCDSTEGLSIVGQGCSASSCCPIRNPIRRLNQRIADLLEQTTLADLLEDEPPGILNTSSARRGAAAADFARVSGDTSGDTAGGTAGGGGGLIAVEA